MMRGALATVGLCSALLIGGLQACSWQPGPAGFWKDYQPHLLVESSNDQGPWGGTRELAWVATGSVRLSRRDVRAYAESHGWRFVDEVDVAAAAAAIEGGKAYPRFMRVPSTVMRFESGWIREDPGTGATTTAYGYAQVASDGSKLYVFHFWGNG